MTEADVIAVLKRLAKGKNGLNQTQLREFVAVLTAQPVDTILEAVFPPKAVRTKAPKAPVEPWIIEIQTAAKKVKWKSAEAISKLYELAERDGYSSKSARQKSLPKAAQDIASQVGQNRTAEMFSKWVENFLADNQMI